MEAWQIAVYNHEQWDSYQIRMPMLYIHTRASEINFVEMHYKITRSGAFQSY